MLKPQDSSHAESESNRVRRQVQVLLRSMTLDAYRKESAEIIRLLANWDLLQQASIIAGFHPSRSEPQIQTLLQGIANTKILLLPRVLPQSNMEFVPVSDIHRELHLATFGLMEPRLMLKAWMGKPPTVFLVPGIAFGKFGERIGHGGGYYDRYLAKFPDSIKIGVALSCQLVPHKLPQLPHDIRMSYIVSPIGILPTGAR